MGDFNLALVIVAIIVCVLVFVFNLYLLVNYQHPDDKNQAYLPKFVVVLGLSLAAISILMLPADVANRQACRHAIYNGACNLTLPMKDLWSRAISPLESDEDSGVTESGELSVGERLDLGIGESANASDVQSSDLNETNVHAKTVPGRPTCPPETSAASSLETPSLRSKTKGPEQSEELLGLIVNSLRALDGAIPQGSPEPRRRPQSAQKIYLVLDKAPKHLQPDLVALVPKLVEHSEHSLAACALLDRLQKPDAEPALRFPVFGALSQLECSSEVWERVLFQSLELLADSNDEPLAAIVDFVFKAAMHCQHLPEAVRSVRVRLKNLGTEVSPCVLDYLSRTVANCADIAESILRDIDSDDNFGDDFSPMFTFWMPSLFSSSFRLRCSITKATRTRRC